MLSFFFLNSLGLKVLHEKSTCTNKASLVAERDKAADSRWMIGGYFDECSFSSTLRSQRFLYEHLVPFCLGPPQIL